MDHSPGAPKAVVIDGADVLTVRTTRDESWADGWSLVLHSVGIPHQLGRGPAGFSLRVAAIDYEAAERAIVAWEQENRESDEARRKEVAEDARPEPGGRTVAGVGVAALLLAFYVVSGSRYADSRWFGAGAAVAERLLHGEWWRAVTALTLHADLGHVLANSVAAAIFVTPVMRALGTGVGGLAVLAAGAGGNMLNALLHGAHHASVGFSTAIFGAIGLLGGLGAARKRLRARGAPAWVAIAAGVALLGLLGSDKQSDVFAHFFGFFVGGTLGVLLGTLRIEVRSFAAQAAFALLSLGVLMACWWLAGAGRFGVFLHT